jgi:hypothetical protein
MWFNDNLAQHEQKIIIVRKETHMRNGNYQELRIKKADLFG